MADASRTESGSAMETRPPPPPTEQQQQQQQEGQLQQQGQPLVQHKQRKLDEEEDELDKPGLLDALDDPSMHSNVSANYRQRDGVAYKIDGTGKEKEMKSSPHDILKRMKRRLQQNVLSSVRDMRALGANWNFALIGSYETLDAKGNFHPGADMVIGHPNSSLRDCGDQISSILVAEMISLRAKERITKLQAEAVRDAGGFCTVSEVWHTA